MKLLLKSTALTLSLLATIAHAGSLTISNSKGFDSNPIVHLDGTLLTDADPVIVAIGTFASEPSTAEPGSGLAVSSAFYLDLLAGFTPYGAPATLVQPVPPLNLQGVFFFQDQDLVTGTPLAGKPVYVVIARGSDLATATHVAILKVNARFEPDDDGSPHPKLVGVGTALGTVTIVGSETRFTASVTSLDPAPNAAYSLSEVIPPPEIVVEQPAGTDLIDGAAVIDFGIVAEGASNERMFTIRNIGFTDLHLSGSPMVAIDGPETEAFALLDDPISPIPPGGATTFTVSFTPGLAGPASAALHISCNDEDENPFDIQLTGLALSFTTDSDSDGLNDATEWKMAALGFDWLNPQPDLVNTLFANAEGAGLFPQAVIDDARTAGRNEVLNDPNAFALFTQQQLQALKPETPLLLRDPATGRFTLLMNWTKSADLMNYVDFPADPARVSVNPDGDIEFEFSSADDAAFFRLEGN